MDYKIHEYSPEELYENKARLFEQLMAEWNNMSANEQEKYNKKVQFTNAGEKAKQRKDESTLETLYETAVEKHHNIQQSIIEEKCEKQTSFEEIKSAEIIKEQQNNNAARFLEEQKQEFKTLNQEFSEKETNSQEPPLKIQRSVIIQEPRDHQVNVNFSQKDEKIQESNEIGEQKDNLGNRRSNAGRKRSQKETVEKIKSKRGSVKKRALSLSKQIQLQQHNNQKHFFVDETLSLKQLKEQIRNLLKQHE
ncbi:unnamed protein product (macronuclear) [Paramecium tetraurelia]|uniref:HMG box domain-containing protein n=1 Tax=Paramecium tetraurelia TaxID=5888 RepID=A0CM47_PARTE|nr:uncharacterized protein GSPATT00008343001 [Paramecium tetraurelia]CAK71864.1 unnamed protein product [Paramecium tetraurelia]|eukprot:XP_001439261.1 hypothetical protein (macronuclear) [Paramecium tetraurelia strain d4-2]